MLFPELINDGRPSVKLNRVQSDACKRYNEKIKSGIYTFEAPECIICGNRDFEELGGKDRYGLYYPTAICNICGLVQSEQRLDQKSAAEFYNSEYPEIYFGSEQPYKKIFEEQYERANLIYRFIKPLLPGGKNPSDILVFEAGCNAGGILKHFSDRGFRTAGLELNAAAAGYANEYACREVTEGSLETIQLKEKPAVFIYSHLLEHLNDPLRELKLIRGNMPDDGLLYIEVPGIKNIHQTYNCNLLLYLQNAHVNHFSLISLRNLLHIAGFEITEADEYIRCVCRKADIHKLVLHNDKQDVIDYLKKVEILRKKYPIRMFRLFTLPKLFLKRLLKLSGLYKVFFRFYHMR
jgi:SAM-dependent methyltransferase